MAGEHKPSEDDLLRRARAVRDQADRISRDGAAPERSGLGEYLSRYSAFAAIMRFFRNLKRWTGPIGRVLGWLFGVIGSTVKFAAFKRKGGDYVLDDDGDLVFSSRRLLTVGLLAVMGAILLHLASSAAYYYGTYFHETVYVTGKQEIETGELYQFGGCTSLPCSTESDNGKFYLIESSLYFPMLFYPEENVFANIPQQDGACKVQGYGIYFRSLRWLYKSAQLYQHVVNVSCRPYTEAEIEQSVASGEIVEK